MRSAVEEQLNLIALGRADFHAVLQHTVEIFKQKFHYFVQSIEAMDQLFEVSFSPLSASGKAHSRYANNHNDNVFDRLPILCVNVNVLYIHPLFWRFPILRSIRVLDVANVVDI